MEPIIFVGIDKYQGNEELVNLHILPEYILYTVAFDEDTNLLLSFYKERSDFEGRNSISDLIIRLKTVKEYGDDVIIEALDYVDNCSVFAAATRIVMDYMTTCIYSNKRIYVPDLGEFVKVEFDKYIRSRVSIFSETEDGRKLLEDYMIRSQSRDKQKTPTL